VNSAAAVPDGAAEKRSGTLTLTLSLVRERGKMFDTKAAKTTRLRPPIVVRALDALSNSRSLGTAELNEVFQSAAIHIGDCPIVHSRFYPVNDIVPALAGSYFER
jgi:hypothetical protein